MTNKSIFALRKSGVIATFAVVMTGMNLLGETNIVEEGTAVAGAPLEAVAEDPALEARQRAETYRQRLNEMHKPLSKTIGEASELEEKANARKETILTENEEAAELKTAIEALEAELAEKRAALDAILTADEELVAFKENAVKKQEEAKAIRMKLGKEISEQMRQRRRDEEARKAAEEEAARKAAEEAEAAENTAPDA